MAALPRRPPPVTGVFFTLHNLQEREFMRWISKETQDNIYCALFFFTIIALKIILPIAYFTYEGVHNGAIYGILAIAIYASCAIFAQPVFYLICQCKDWLLHSVLKRERKEKPLAKWKEWIIDIAVSPNVLDNYRVARAISEGYSKALDHPAVKEAIHTGYSKISNSQTGKKILDIAESVINESGKLNQTTNEDKPPKNTFSDTLKDLAKGKLPPISENLINECIKSFGQDCFVELHKRCCILHAENIKAWIDYNSCEFDKELRSITFKILDLKPFYYKPFLGMIHKKFPFLQHRKDEEKTRLITCHLNQIPSVKNNKILNSDYMRYVTIDHLNFEEGAVEIKLKLRPLKSFLDIATKLTKQQT
jgi:hypothetical protein